jgi:DNA polymerase III subunit epsilon
MFSFSTPFTVFDVETTGLNPRKGDRIVEIAGARVEGEMPHKETTFTTLVNPEQPVSWEAKQVHNITDADLVGAPLITEVLPKFLEFAGGSILVAHNAEFDLGFLEAEKELCWGYVDIPECLCTLHLSRSVFPGEYRHNLDAVASRLGLPARQGHHRALSDVLQTANVFLKLIEHGGISSFEELRQKALPKLSACR